jgi:hypothetical protein
MEVWDMKMLFHAIAPCIMMTEREREKERGWNNREKSAF